jgi:hypothetical protein
LRFTSFGLLKGTVMLSLTAAAVVGVRYVRPGTPLAHSAVRQGAFRDPISLDPATPSGVVELDIASDATGTFLGMKDELLLDRMKRGEILQAKMNKGGSSISFRLDFADGSRAAFKPEQTNPQTVPRKEIAAYRLNRLLGLNRVPPATSRTLHQSELLGKLPPEALFLTNRIMAETLFDDEGFTRGELSYWVPVILDSHLDTPENIAIWQKWMAVDGGEPIPEEKVDLMAQLSALLLFDLLTNNSDRFSGGNLMASKDGRVLYFMDNTFGFQVEPEGHMRCRAALLRCQKFGRKIVDALRRLDAASLRQALDVEPGILTEAEQRAVLARRDVALRYIDGLVAQHGAEKVLVFP